MHTILLVVQILVTIALVGVILIQRSSTDGLSGLGGGSGGGGNALFSSRASANILTRSTAILATLFMLNSLALGILAARSSTGRLLLDQYEIEEQQPAAPAKPATPTVPIAQ